MSANPAKLAHGPALAGIFLNIFLYGVMFIQTFLYYTNFKKDPTWVKAYVSALFIADTLNSVFNIWWIYNSLVNNFNNPAALAKADWLFQTEPAFSGIIGMMAQLFFAWRVWALTKSYFCTGIIVLTSLTAGIAALAVTYYVGIINEWARFQEFKGAATVWLLGAAVCDVMITGVLTWFLRTRRSKFVVTNALIDRVIIGTLQNGMATSMLAIVDLIAYLASPTGLHIAFNYVLVKLYTNSVMSSLNSRSGWKLPGSTNNSHATETGSGPIELRDPTSGMWKKDSIVNTKAAPPAEVFVNVESHQMSDQPSKSAPGWDGSDRSIKDSAV
ncbi:hypothetical protein PLICRDRAFT_176478 [Plicaturopsis crispa FD-325 SS-3]|nr:hypothetical protein PLICRDRAFT_176478 [Plicaturopsis crispa FD-325 SS-3]